jgi:AcrR family transcriptional regulator
MSSKDAITDNILNAALTLANQFGYGSLSLSELARQANITKQRLYYHFPTPESVILALATKWGQTGQACTIEVLANDTEGGALKLLAIAKGMFYWMKKYPELSRLGLVLYQSGPHIPELSQLMDGVRKTGRSRIKLYLVLDKKFAKMKPKELEEFTTSLHSYMYGFFFYVVAMNDFGNLATHENACIEGLRNLISAHSK